MRLRSGLPLGVNAAFFEEAKRVRRLEARLTERLEGAGYDEVLLPILDYYEPYQELLGERLLRGNQADQLYRFVDRDGQLLALRYDFTPMLARLAAPQIGSWTLPARLFYRGDVVRYQEPRPGRLRESAQLGVEILDAPDAENEQEALELFVELLLSSTRTDEATAADRPVEIVLGVAGALDALVTASSDPAATVEALARRDRRVAELGGAELLEVVQHGLPRDTATLGEHTSAVEELQRRREALLEALGSEAESRRVRVHIDLAEFATFGSGGQEGEHPYYDGLMFRAYLAGAAQPVGNGGRYDGLFRALRADVSATGFSLGLDQLLEASS